MRSLYIPSKPLKLISFSCSMSSPIDLPGIFTCYERMGSRRSSRHLQISGKHTIQHSYSTFSIKTFLKWMPQRTIGKNCRIRMRHTSAFMVAIGEPWKSSQTSFSEFKNTFNIWLRFSRRFPPIRICSMRICCINLCLTLSERTLQLRMSL